jgi:hypothetical protein
LLEYHFDLIFPRVEQLVEKDALFADMFCRCWKLGQSELPANATLPQTRTTPLPHQSAAHWACG